VPTRTKKEAGLNQPLFFQGLELFLQKGFSKTTGSREASLLALIRGRAPPTLSLSGLGVLGTAVLIATPAVLQMIIVLVHGVMFPELRLIRASAARQERNQHDEKKQLLHDSNPPSLN